jgi:Pup amidohydrolase
MSVRRIMGIETEYGISVPGHPHVNAMLTSTQIVQAYGRSVRQGSGSRARWNYSEESPLRDARGYELPRSAVDQATLTDDEDLGLANVVLPNGARLYVDHAHPEYSTPEVTNPRDAVIWDRAGISIMQDAMRLVAGEVNPTNIVLYKNNTDNKGASYGCHENYLMRRDVAFGDIVRGLTPFFVSRQIFTGSGRVGIGQAAQSPGFQISQRADYFETEVGLETTLKRPIINTRDEPHADPELYRRLHVIVGDANLSEVATYVKMGTTSIVLTMIESGFLTKTLPIVKNPVNAIHQVSHDPHLRQTIELNGGEQWSAIDLQRYFLDQAHSFYETSFEGEVDAMTLDVLSKWEMILDLLSTDIFQARELVDWIAKYVLLNTYRDRDGLPWDSAKLELVDLQYSDLREDKGLSFVLERRHELQRMSTPEEVAHAVACPPTDTRAYFRGRCIEQFPDAIAAASWDSLVFDVPGRDSLIRVPTLDPWRGTRAHTQSLFDESTDVESLLVGLEAPRAS